MKTPGAPLRLTWDWAWPPVVRAGSQARRPAQERQRAIGAEIVRARVLLLEVGYPDVGALDGGEVAAALAGFEGSLELVLDPTTATALANGVPAADMAFEEIWLDATPGTEPLPDELDGWPAVRLYVTAGNLEEAAARLERALSRGARAISLPGLPLFGDLLRDAAAAPSAAQMTGLAARIAAAARGLPEIDLRVHHYGLWRALREAGVTAHGEEDAGTGCQAGSSLGYVDPAGILYPCAALPVPLARLGEGTIRDAWSGPEVAALRDVLSRLPARCAGCPWEPTCHGGCRGWAHYLHASWEVTGPDCAWKSV